MHGYVTGTRAACRALRCMHAEACPSHSARHDSCKSKAARPTYTAHMKHHLPGMGMHGAPHLYTGSICPKSTALPCEYRIVILAELLWLGEDALLEDFHR